jgi:hypothetical protein
MGVLLKNAIGKTNGLHGAPRAQGVNRLQGFLAGAPTLEKGSQTGLAKSKWPAAARYFCAAFFRMTWG